MSEQFAKEVIAQGDSLQVADEATILAVANKINGIADEMAKAKDDDTARWQALNEERVEQTALLQDLKERRDKEERESVSKAALDEARELVAEAKAMRAPSKAHLVVGGGGMPAASTYEKGTLIRALMVANDPRFLDAERREAYAVLESIAGSYQRPNPDAKGAIGSSYVERDATLAEGIRDSAEAKGGFALPQMVIQEHAKATLGLTAATGGFIMPNAQVSDLVKPGVYRPAVTGLVSAIRGVSNQLTQIPVRTTTPTRAAVVAWGDQKTTASLAYGGYTATMYTLAIIYDLAKQFVRFSAGAAEQDVLQELAHAFALGEAYYILQGSGSSEPYGIQTAIATAFSAYTTSFSPSATTLAGSIAKAIATAAGDLAVRTRNPEAVLLGPAAFWTMVSQGTDTAGFFFAPAGGPENIRPGTLMSPFGVPVYSETQLAGSDDLLIGEWSALKVFFGEGYRVDTSDEAYDRWDKNLIGYRGEEEMALDARAAVFSGAFQFIADVMP